MRTTLLALLSCLTFTSLAHTQSAQEELVTQPTGKPSKSLWEVGVGAIGAYGPDYPAAGENSFNGLPIPYVIYRGDVLKIGDGGGVRGVLVDNERFEFTLSADASFNAESEDNEARKGMPDLNFLAEVGPQLKVKLISTPLQSLELRLPVRAVFELEDFTPQAQGYTFAPRLSARQSGVLVPGLAEPLTVFGSIGPTFATEKLHRYFYNVRPNEVRAGRPAYQADGGYLGTEASLGAAYDLSPQTRLFAGTQLGYYGGAANENSPLFKDKLNAGVAVGFAWSFYQSAARAPR